MLVVIVIVVVIVVMTAAVATDKYERPTEETGRRQLEQATGAGTRAYYHKHVLHSFGVACTVRVLCSTRDVEAVQRALLACCMDKGCVPLLLRSACAVLKLPSVARRVCNRQLDFYEVEARVPKLTSPLSKSSTAHRSVSRGAAASPVRGAATAEQGRGSPEVDRDVTTTNTAASSPSTLAFSGAFFDTGARLGTPPPLVVTTDDDDERSRFNGFTAADMARSPLPFITSPELLRMRYACESGKTIDDDDMAVAKAQTTLVMNEVWACTCPRAMLRAVQHAIRLQCGVSVRV